MLADTVGISGVGLYKWTFVPAVRQRPFPDLTTVSGMVVSSIESECKARTNVRWQEPVRRSLGQDLPICPMDLLPSHLADVVPNDAEPSPLSLPSKGLSLTLPSTKESDQKNSAGPAHTR